MPRIEISGSPDAIRKLKTALGAGAIPDLYVTGGRPVRIERVSGTLAVDLDGDAPLPVVSTPVTPPLLAHLLAAHTYTYRWGSRKDEQGRAEFFEQETTPGPAVLSAVLAGAEWPAVPTLAGIIGTPVLRRDWSLLQAPGYDPASGLYLSPTVTLPPVPGTPTAAQVARARSFLLSTLLGDFEWEDAASLANYVALMVTPFLRRPLSALVPLAILSASTASSGKSLLSALIGLLVGQQTVPWPADNDAELEKLITSTFTAESGAVIFDNLAEGEVIGSPILANLLTNPMWSAASSANPGWAPGPTTGCGWSPATTCASAGTSPPARSPSGSSPPPRTPRPAPASPSPTCRAGSSTPATGPGCCGACWSWSPTGSPPEPPATPPSRRCASSPPGHTAPAGSWPTTASPGSSPTCTPSATWTRKTTNGPCSSPSGCDRLGPGLHRVADVLASGDPGRDRDTDPWGGDFITDDKGRLPRTPQKLGRMLAGQTDRWHGDPPLTLRAHRIPQQHPPVPGRTVARMLTFPFNTRNTRSTPSHLQKQPISIPAPNTRRYPQIPAVQPALRVSNTAIPARCRGIDNHPETPF